MKIIETTFEPDNIEPGCVLTIGNFDGVHIGHEAIFKAASQIASQNKIRLAALTFEPHPVAVLYPEKTSGVLTPLLLKKRFLESFGVDVLVVLRDSREFLSLSPQEFVEKYLPDLIKIKPSVVVEGEDFNFGKNRTGNIHTLSNLGDRMGFRVKVVETKKAKLSIGASVRVSSTLIRNLLTSGNVSDATTALGRPYRLMGQVVPGKGKGKELGFPTANIRQTNQIVPEDGVYAGFAAVADTEEQVCAAKSSIMAAISIGTARTFGQGQPQLIEAHLLRETRGELANRWLAIDFVKFIREQRHFDSVQALTEQIAKDCQKAKEILPHPKI